jgi:hypothetical protein
MTEDEDPVTIYRVHEPPSSPGWRAVEDSPETATVSYQVPRSAWDAYRAAEREFERAAATIGRFILDT